MKTNEELEEELEELKKGFYFFSKNGNSGSGTGGNTGSTSPSTDDDEGWTVVFDKDSTDPNINLGHTTGMHSNIGILTTLPDLINYTKVRFIFHVPNCTCNYDFYITKNGYNELHFWVHNALPTDFYTCTNFVKTDENGKLVLGIGAIYKLFIYLSASKAPVRTHCANDQYVYYEKILIK